VARDELAEPDGGLLALAAQTDQLDLEFRTGEMAFKVTGRADLDGPRGDALRRRLPETGTGAVSIERSSAHRTPRPTVRIEMQPGTGRNIPSLGFRPDRQDLGGNPVDARVIPESTAHTYVAINGQDVGPSGQRQRIAADPRAEVDNQRPVESSRLMPGDGLRSGLFDPRRLDPHLLAALELHGGPCLSSGQADRGRHTHR